MSNSESESTALSDPLLYFSSAGMSSQASLRFFFYAAHYKKVTT